MTERPRTRETGSGRYYSGCVEEDRCCSLPGHRRRSRLQHLSAAADQALVVYPAQHSFRRQLWAAELPVACGCRGAGLPQKGSNAWRSNLAAAIINVLKLSVIFIVLFIVIKWQLLNVFGLVGGLSLCFLAILWQGLTLMKNVSANDQ